MGTQIISRSSSGAFAQGTARRPLGVAFEDVEQVVGRIRQELQILRSEHAALAKRIGLIKHTLAGLNEVFGADVAGQPVQSMLSPPPVKRRRILGLTDACREFLVEVPEPQTLKQISGRIQERYPTLLTHHKYPMTVVQMMLRRLVMYGEAVEVDTLAGLRAWKSTSTPR